LLTFTFSASIFKILADSKNKVLAIEIRNADLKEVSFAVINLDNQSLLLEETGFEEAWRVGLSAIENHIVLLHLYADTHLPDRKGIYAINFAEQEVVWEQNAWTFENLFRTHNKINEIDEIIVSAFQFEHGNKEIAHFDLQNGGIIQLNSNSISKKSELLQNCNPIPYFYASENEYFNTISNFIKPYFNPSNLQNTTENIIEIIGFDYVETNKNFTVLAYYKNIAKNPTINATIFVFDSKGTKYFEKNIMNNYLMKDVGNRISVFGNYLCVLENSNSISILDLV
jgi:hypothetical protein